MDIATSNMAHNTFQKVQNKLVSTLKSDMSSYLQKTNILFLLKSAWKEDMSGIFGLEDEVTQFFFHL